MAEIREHDEQTFIVTPGGKEIGLVKDQFGLFSLEFKSGGPLPKEFKQKFTNPTLAYEVGVEYADAKQKAIDLAATKIEEEQAAKAEAAEIATLAKKQAAKQTKE